MKYAIVVWMSESEVQSSEGSIYGWYESLATALNTAVNLRQSGKYWQASVVKLI